MVLLPRKRCCESFTFRRVEFVLHMLKLCVPTSVATYSSEQTLIGHTSLAQNMAAAPDANSMNYR